MKWYEIIGFVVVWILGLRLGVKFYEFRKNMFHNDSWKNRKKN